jgi:hypothetical protein
MKTLLIPFIAISILSCNREYNNPTETDTDLSVQPQITRVQETSEHFIALSLNYSFSDSAEIILERRKTSALEHITFKKESRKIFPMKRKIHFNERRDCRIFTRFQLPSWRTRKRSDESV